ncbi:hypothetical protein ACVI1J_001402 [Bradyrhizobium diazoefficiens]
MRNLNSNPPEQEIETLFQQMERLLKALTRSESIDNATKRLLNDVYESTTSYMKRAGIEKWPG